MSAAETVFAIRKQGVVHDTIDGETLVIDLETGSYYTLAGAGAVVWRALVAGARYEDLIRAGAEALGIDRDEAAGPVARLIAELVRADLIRCADGSKPEPPSAEAGGEQPPGLELNSYDELQELMVLDPIHEVDEAGWPHRAPESA